MRRMIARTLALALLASFMLICVPFLAIAANVTARSQGDGYPEAGKVQTGAVTVKKNVYESFGGQAGIDEYTITATIIPPQGETLPDGLPGVPSGNSYKLTLKMGQSAIFAGLPYGTTFKVYEDPDDYGTAEYYSFATTYTVDGSNSDMLTVSKRSHTIEVNNDYRKSPCAEGSVRVTKAVAGEDAPAEGEFSFLITFYTDAQIPGISDEDPDTAGTQYSFTINYSADGTANSRVFTGIPAGTQVAVRETTTGEFSASCTVNGNTGDAGTTLGNCELTFICTNTYRDGAEDGPTKGRLTVQKLVQLLNGAIEPAGASYNITVLFIYTGSETLPSFDDKDIDKVRPGIQFKLRASESITFDNLPPGTEASVEEDSGSYTGKVTIDGIDKNNVIISGNHGATVTNRYGDTDVPVPGEPSVKPPATPSGYSSPSGFPSTDPASPDPSASASPSGEEIDVTDTPPPLVPYPADPSPSGKTPDGMPYTGGSIGFGFLGMLGIGCVAFGLVIGKKPGA